MLQVIKKAGGVTHWSDKHPAYDIVNGPGGDAVDDLCAPLSFYGCSAVVSLPFTPTGSHALSCEVSIAMRGG